MPQDMFIELSNLELQGGKFAIINTTAIFELEERLAKRKATNKALKLCASRNNKGREYEKAGKIKQAISIYEKNIEGDCYPATHSFERLMVLYRKMKDYENEKRVIERALVVFVDDEVLYSKYSERLIKVRALYAKEFFKN